MDNQHHPATTNRPWTRSAGALFVILTAAPMAAGCLIGMRTGHPQWGAIYGTATGVALAIRLVIVPLWREADSPPPTLPEACAEEGGRPSRLTTDNGKGKIQ